MNLLGFAADSSKGQYDLNPMSPAAGVSVPDSATAWTVLCSTQVPAGSKGVGRAWGVSIPDAAKATLRLGIRVNGASVRNYPDGVTQLVGGLRSDEMEEVWVGAAAMDLVELVAGQNSGAAATCHGRMKLFIQEV